MPKGWDFSSDFGDRWMVHSQEHVAQISSTVFKVGEENLLSLEGETSVAVYVQDKSSWSGSLQCVFNCYFELTFRISN